MPRTSRVFDATEVRLQQVGDRDFAGGNSGIADFKTLFEKTLFGRLRRGPFHPPRFSRRESSREGGLDA